MINLDASGRQEAVLVYNRESPGFPKVMLCLFWKSVGRRPVASQTLTRTVPLNMAATASPRTDTPPPRDHFHTINPLVIIEGASFGIESLDSDDIGHGWILFVYGKPIKKIGLFVV